MLYLVESAKDESEATMRQENSHSKIAMYKMKAAASILLSVILVVSFLPTDAFAANASEASAGIMAESTEEDRTHFRQPTHNTDNAGDQERDKRVAENLRLKSQKRILPKAKSLSHTVGNEYVQCVVDDNGEFNIGTAEGTCLLFWYPDGRTSQTLVRIDGSDYWFSDWAENTTVTGDTCVTTATIDEVEIKQIISIVQDPSSQTQSLISINYSYRNISEHQKSVGFRVMLDTMLGDNDGAPFAVGRYRIVSEREYRGNKVPKSYQATDSFEESTQMASGYLNINGRIPDKIQFADWSSIHGSGWDYEITPGCEILGDSAVAVYFCEKDTSAGAGETVGTSYGASSQLWDGDLNWEDGGYAISSVGFAYNDRSNTYRGNVLKDVKTLDLSLRDTPLSLKVNMADKTLPIGRMSLIVDKGDSSTKIATTGADGEFKNLTLNKFSEKGKVYVYVYDKNDNLRCRAPLALKFIKAKTTYSSMKIADKFEFEIGDDVFGGLLKGHKFSSSLISCPITSKVAADGTLQMGFNLDVTKADNSLIKSLKKGTSFNTNKRQLSKALINKDSGLTKGASIAPIFNIIGYAEGSPDATKLKGKLYVEFGVKASAEVQWLCFVGEISGSAKGTAGGVVEINSAASSDQMLKGAIDVGAKGKLGIYGGVGGARVASVGIYADASLEGEYRLIPYAKSGLLELTAKGNIGLKAKFLGGDVGEIEILHGEAPLYKRDKGLTALQTMGSSKEKALQDENQLIDIDLSQKYEPVEALKSLSSIWMGSSREKRTNNESSMLKTNVYPDAQPKLVNCSGGPVLFFLDSVDDRPTGNKSCLSYSLYQQATRTWSQPKIVVDDGTPDYSFDVFACDSEINIVWQNARSEVATGDSLSKVASNVDLSYAKLDMSKNELSDIGKVTDNEGVCEIAPRITCVDGTVGVAWIENSDNSPFQNSESSCIKKAELVASKWEESVIGCIEGSAVTALAIGSDAGNMSVAWTSSSKGSLAQPENTSLSSDLRGTILSAGSGNPCFISAKGKEILTAYHNGGIYDITSGVYLMGQESLNSPDYLLTSDSQDNLNAVQLYLEQDKSQIRVYRQSDKGWTKALRAVDTSNLITGASACIVENQLGFVYSEQLQGNGSNESNLVFSKGETGKLEVSEIEGSGRCDSNGIAKIGFVLSNNGTQSAFDPEIAVLNDSGETVATCKIDGELEAGNSAECTVDVTNCSVSGASQTYAIQPVMGEGGVNFEINPCDAELLLANEVEGSKETITANLSNEGACSLDNLTIEFYNVDTDEVLGQKQVAELEINGTATASYELSVSSTPEVKMIGVRVVASDLLPDLEEMSATWDGGRISQEILEEGDPANTKDDNWSDDDWEDDWNDPGETTPAPTPPSQITKPIATPLQRTSIAPAKITVKPKTYTGKKLKPVVPTVKLGGKALRNGVDFTYSCKGGKKVGSYKVTITGKGAYAGTKTATFQIVPKGTSVKKLSKARKAFTVKWKKPSKANLKQTTGYQVRWSTSKRFTKKTTKTKTVKTTSKAGKTCQLKVTKLKAKKKYYVQVRTYKKVGGKTYCSSWSKAKAVKTKR